MAELKLSDIMKGINFTKDDTVVNSENQSEYIPFVVNKCLSYFPDILLTVNELNSRPAIPRKEQYLFYIHSIPKRKRFHPWVKIEKEKDVVYIQKYFGVSYDKAKEYEKILDEGYIDFIKSEFEVGG